MYEYIDVCVCMSTFVCAEPLRLHEDSDLSCAYVDMYEYIYVCVCMSPFVCAEPLRTICSDLSCAYVDMYEYIYVCIYVSICLCGARENYMRIAI